MQRITPSRQGRKSQLIRHSTNRPASSIDADDFRRGFYCVIWEKRQETRARFWDGDLQQSSAAVAELSAWLDRVHGWSPQRAEAVLRQLQGRVPHLVDRCIQEGRRFRRDIALGFCCTNEGAPLADAVAPICLELSLDRLREVA
jgi:hypothetical protein